MVTVLKRVKGGSNVLLFVSERSLKPLALTVLGIRVLGAPG